MAGHIESILRSYILCCSDSLREMQRMGIQEETYTMEQIEFVFINEVVVNE